MTNSGLASTVALAAFGACLLLGCASQSADNQIDAGGPIDASGDVTRGGPDAVVDARLATEAPLTNDFGPSLDAAAAEDVGSGRDVSDHTADAASLGGCLLCTRAELLEAVSTVFALYSSVPCSSLRFEYGGQVSTDAERVGGVVVAFRADPNPESWAFQWHATPGDGSRADGRKILSSAVLRVQLAGHEWSLDERGNTLDVQSSLLRMIPRVVGYRGDDHLLLVGHVERELTSVERQGVQALYFDESAESCQRPQMRTCQDDLFDSQCLDTAAWIDPPVRYYVYMP